MRRKEMEEINTAIKWHKFPDEKPANGTCKYIVIYNWYGEYKATDSVWAKGKFSGAKNSLIKAWTEIPYAMLRGIDV